MRLRCWQLEALWALGRARKHVKKMHETTKSDTAAQLVLVGSSIRSETTRRNKMHVDTSQNWYGPDRSTSKTVQVRPGLTFLCGGAYRKPVLQDVASCGEANLDFFSCLCPHVGGAKSSGTLGDAQLSLGWWSRPRAIFFYPFQPSQNG